MSTFFGEKIFSKTQDFDESYVILLSHESDAEPLRQGGFFSTFDQRRAMRVLADYVYPGSGAKGVTSFVDQFMTAFQVHPPRIYAGGPSSGRKPASSKVTS